MSLFWIVPWDTPHQLKTLFAAIMIAERFKNLADDTKDLTETLYFIAVVNQFLDKHKDVKEP